MAQPNLESEDDYEYVACASACAGIPAMAILLLPAPRDDDVTPTDAIAAMSPSLPISLCCRTWQPAPLLASPSTVLVSLPLQIFRARSATSW